MFYSIVNTQEIYYVLQDYLLCSNMMEFDVEMFIVAYFTCNDIL